MPTLNTTYSRTEIEYINFIIRHATYLTRIWGYTERDVFFLYTPGTMDYKR